MLLLAKNKQKYWAQWPGLPSSPDVNQRWIKYNKRRHYIHKDVQIQNKQAQKSQPPC